MRLLAVLLALVAAAVCTSPAWGYATQLKRYPYLTDVVGSSAIVNWGTDRSSTTAVVKWGISGTESCTAHSTTATSTSITVGSVAQYQWKAKLTLQPNTRYCYRVYLGSGSTQVDLLGTDATPQFLTQVPAGSTAPYSFAVFGDWGQVTNSNGTNPEQANLMSRIAQSGARFAVTTGDNAYGSGSQTNYGDLVQTGVDTSAVFGPSFWKAPGASMPLFPALGNHGATGTGHLVNWPQDTAVASSAGRYQSDTYCCLNGTTSASYPSAWYAFDAGNARFYILEAAWPNSNVGSADLYKNDFDYHWAPGSPQRQWLQNDLAANPRQLKFAFFHFPLYSDNSTESEDLYLRSASSLEGLLASYNVTLAFNGHAHMYQRNRASSLGLTTYLTGGGGATPQPISGCSTIDAYGIGWSNSSSTGSKCGSAPVPTSKAQVIHFLLVTVNGTSVTVTPTNSLGQAFDPVTYNATPAQSADLSITNTDSPDPVPAGQTLTYTLTARNLSSTQATGVTVTDTLPAGVTYQSATPSQGTCSQSAGTVSCSLGSLAGSAQATVQVVVRPAQAGQITSQAQVSGAQSDPTPANNSASQTTTVNPAADLALTNTDSPDPATVGQPLTYTLTATNAGPSAATAVTLTDTLPTGVTYQSATPSQGTCAQGSGTAARTVTCSFGTLASSAAASVDIRVTPQATGLLTNQASVSSAVTDPVSSNNSASQSTTVNAAADMSLTNTDAPDPVAVGQTLTYRLTASNRGPAQATGVTITDNLPAGVTFSSATPSQGTCTTSGTGGGAGTPVTLTPQADTYVDSSTPTVNNGIATKLRTDASPVIRSYLRFDLGGISGPLASAKLRIFGTSANSTGYEVRGVSSNTWSETTVDYNTSPAPGAVVGSSGAVTSNAWTEVGVSSLVSSGGGLLSVALTSLSSTATTYNSREAGTNLPQLVVTPQAAPTVTCGLGTVASGGLATVDVRVTPQALGQITNQASVAAAQSDPAPADNSASQTTTVAQAADLSITKADSPDPVSVGQQLTYTLTAANGGPAPASGVTVTDTLPANVSYQSATPSQGTCTQSSGTVTCALGSLAGGAQATVRIAVSPLADGQITNQAQVAGNQADPNGANNSATQSTTVSTPPDLSLTKADSPDPVLVGQTLTYTLTARNLSGLPATGVSVSDTLPSGVTYQSATPSQGTCAASGTPASTVTCDLGTLAASAQATIDIRVTPQAAGTITNQASVSGGQVEPVLTNNSAGATTTVGPAADLSLTQSDSPDPVLAGEALAYTVTAHNAGPSDATGVTITDSLPASVSFQSATPSQGTCSRTGGVVTCNLGNLASGGDATVQISVRPLQEGQITNQASVAGDQGDPSTPDNSSSVVTTVSPAADLSLAKADSPDPVAAGQVLTYTLSALNGGPSQATGVTVTDSLPASVSYQSATASQGGCTEAAGTVTCNLGTLASSAQATVQIAVRPQTAGDITNEARTGSDQADPNPANNSGTQTTTVTASADLSLTNVDSPDPVFVGQPLTYTLTARNAGPSQATGVTVTDTLPAGVTYQGATPSQGSCDEPVGTAAGTVTCRLGTLPGSGQASIDIRVSPQFSGQLANQASVAADQADAASSNNSAGQVTTVSPSADVALSNADSPDPVAVGRPLTYRLTASNQGPSQATGVTVTDDLSAGVTFSSASPSQGSCTTTATQGPAGAPVTLAPQADAYVDSSTPTASNGIATKLRTDASPVVRSYLRFDLGAAAGSITSAKLRIFAGSANSAGYEVRGVADNGWGETTINYNNSPVPGPVVGTSGAVSTGTWSEVDVSSLVSSGALASFALTSTSSTATTYTSREGGANAPQLVLATAQPGNPIVTCSFGTLAGAAQATVDIQVTPQSLGQITNSASVTAAQNDAVPANNSASQSTAVTAPADLSIVKTDSPDPVGVGETLTYTLTATNDGPASATGATVMDTLPGNVSYQSATASQGSCAQSAGTVTCSFGSLANGAQASAQIAVRTESDGQMTNQAQVVADQADPDSANNSATESTTVSTPPDLSLAKVGAPDPVLLGQPLTYTLAATNHGSSQVTGVRLTDALPVGVRYESVTPSQGSCSQAGGTVTCNLGTLAGLATASVQIRVTPLLTGAITNEAVALGDQGDPLLSNNTASTTTTVVPAADLSLTTSDSPDPVSEGAVLTYTLTAHNAGPSLATGVQISDALPAGVTYLSATPSQGTCSQSQGNLTCDLQSLAGSAQATVEVSVQTHSPGQITNQATVGADQADPVPSDNSATAVTTVAPVADLSLTMTGSPDPVVSGQLLTYTLTARNAGPSPASGVTVTDDLPAGTTYRSATSSQGTCSPASGPTAAGTVTCALGTLGASGQATVEVQVTPTSPGQISNDASISAVEADPVPGNNSAGTTTTVDAAVDLSLSVADSPDPVLAGQLLTYTLTARNESAAQATGVTLTDQLPPDVAYVSASPSQGSCSEDGGEVSCRLGTLAASAQATVEIQVTPRQPGDITNSASVSADQLDPALANNATTEQTAVSSPADLSLSKADSPDPVLAGQTLTYALTVTNHGPAEATGVSVADELPAGVEFLSAAPSRGTCSHAQGSVTCSLGALASSEGGSIEIEVTPRSAGRLVNTASVSGDQGDPVPANNSAETTTTVEPAADVRLSKSDSPDPAAVERLLDYTLTVTNDGPSPATNVELTDSLPDGVTYQSGTASQGSCTESSGAVTCRLGTLAASAQATAHIEVIPHAAGDIVNRASVTADESDPALSNNSASEQTTVNPPVDLSLAKSDSPDPVLAGETLTYTLLAHNSGSTDATGVTVTDNLPAGVSYRAATSSQGSCSESGGTVTCSLGSLSPSAQATAEIRVVPESEGEITNNASVTGDQSDPSPDNNAASATTTVNPAADLQLGKVDSPDPVAAGQDVTYTLTVQNLGPSEATGITLTDTLPAGTAYGSASPSQGSCSDSAATVSCDIGTLNQFGVATVQVTVTTQLDGLIVNQASVTANEADPRSSNNTAAESTTVTPAADLALTKSDSPDPVTVGQPLTYTMTADNRGPSRATGVTVTDTLPSSVTYLSATPSQGTCAVSGATTAADTATLTPTADSYVDSSVPTGTTGLATKLRTDASPIVRSYLRFDLGSVTGLVTSARLRVFASSANNVGYDVRGVADNTWGETTINYSNSPAAGTVAGSSGQVATGAWTEVDVTPLVTGSGLLSMAMTSTSATATSFASRESGATAPQLVLTLASNTTVACDLGALEASSQATVEVQVRPRAQGQLSNTAQVGASQADPQPANNSADQSTTVLP